MTIPQHIKDEADKYANQLSKNDTYREYLRNAYISGRMKSEGECVEFLEFRENSYHRMLGKMVYKKSWGDDKREYTATELFAIFKQSKATK